MSENKILCPCSFFRIRVATPQTSVPGQRRLGFGASPEALGPLVGSTFLFQLLKALAYLRRQKLIHLDLKPANIFVKFNRSAMVGPGSGSSLVGKRRHRPLSAETLKRALLTSTIQLGDFGEMMVSEEVEEEKGEIAKDEPRVKKEARPPTYRGPKRGPGEFCPPGWRSPEILLGDWPLTPAVDMWSAAVTFWVWCFGGIFRGARDRADFSHKFFSDVMLRDGRGRDVFYKETKM